MYINIHTIFNRDTPYFRFSLAAFLMGFVVREGHVQSIFGRTVKATKDDGCKYYNSLWLLATVVILFLL